MAVEPARRDAVLRLARAGESLTATHNAGGRASGVMIGPRRALRPGEFDWRIDNREARLRAMAARGCCAAEIGRALGCSTDRARSKAVALGLALKDGRGAANRRDARQIGYRAEERQVAERKAAAAARSFEIPAWEALPDPSAADMALLQAVSASLGMHGRVTSVRTCQAISGDPRVDASVCGRDCIANLAYCCRHAVRMLDMPRLRAKARGKTGGEA